jgi:hypothetical protein
LNVYPTGPMKQSSKFCPSSGTVFTIFVRKVQFNFLESCPTRLAGSGTTFAGPDACCLLPGVFPPIPLLQRKNHVNQLCNSRTGVLSGFA